MSAVFSAVLRPDRRRTRARRPGTEGGFLRRARCDAFLGIREKKWSRSARSGRVVSPIAGICLRCKRITPLGSLKSGRCPECASKHNKERMRFRREVSEPWVDFYTHPQWRAVRARVVKRDGGRCRAIEDGVRCAETTNLEVHHDLVWIGALWQAAGGEFKRFLRLACEESQLVTLCRSHHRRADAARRRGRS